MAEPPLYLGCYTTCGRREENQDDLLCLQLDAPEKSNVKAVMAVADGLGGEVGGEVASKIAVDALKKYVMSKSNISIDSWRKSMAEIYKRANSNIIKYGRKNKDYSGMGTTFVCALVIDYQLMVANVGDSKLYRVAGKQVQQVTRDHNMLAQYMAKKKYSMKFLRRNEANLSSSLLRTLGEEATLKVDCFPRKGDRGFPLQEGDVYILCSDGLTGSPIEPFLSDREIIEVLATTKNMNQACKKMTKLAYKNGSDDNITIVALKVGSKKKKKRIITGSLRLPKK